MHQYDNKILYCRSLGHEISFQYCRTVQNDLPCFRILDCWFEKIPIEAFVNEHFTDEEKEKIFIQPKQKIVTLFELIEQAKKNM